jgi:tetratricopeptide (TPR) repeat protein
MRPSVSFVLPFLAFVIASSAAFAAGSTPKEPTIEAGSEPSAEDRAIEHYNAGLASRDEAWRLERKLEDAAPEERAKLTAKIDRAFARAVKDLTAAVEADPDMHEAWSSLGYALRRSGDANGALEAYDRALALAPAYGEAIEYRGEAYLALGRIDDAQRAFDELLPSHPKLADELLGAMRSWIEARRAEPAGIDVGQLDELERWVDSRGRGELPRESSLGKTRGW